jgi:hypothetical protein
MNMSDTSGSNGVGDYQTYPESTASEYIWKICPPLLILCGTVGNIVSIIVLRRPKVRKAVCSFYFIALAASDLLVLYTGLLRQWIYYTFNFDVRHLGTAGCKLHTWLVYFSLHFSSWILVAVTIERIMLVWFPIVAKTTCTKRTVTINIIAICICLLLVNSHILYGKGQYLEQRNGTTYIHMCVFVSKSYKTFWESTWQSIDMAIFCGVPFFCLLIGNILICVKVRLSRLAVKRNATINRFGTPKCKDSKFSSMSVMLLTINTTFLICNTPISIYLIGLRFWISDLSEKDKANIDLIWSIVNILMYLSNSINLLMYILSGSLFRKEIRTVLTGKQH